LASNGRMFAVVALAAALAVSAGGTPLRPGWVTAGRSIELLVVLGEFANMRRPIRNAVCQLGGTSNTVPDGGCPNEVCYRHLTGTFLSLMR